MIYSSTDLLHLYIKVFWVGLGGLLIIICVPAMAPSHNSAKWVFTEFINRTGYDSNGLAFFLGMVYTKKRLQYTDNINVFLNNVYSLMQVGPLLAMNVVRKLLKAQKTLL